MLKRNGMEWITD